MMLVAVAVEPVSCQHKHNSTERKMHLLAISLQRVFIVEAALEQVDSMSGLQFGIDKTSMKHLKYICINMMLTHKMLTK